MVTLYANVYVKHSFFCHQVTFRNVSGSLQSIHCDDVVSLQTTFLCILVAYLYRFSENVVAV